MLSILTTGLAIWVILGQPAVILLPALVINFVVYFTQGKKINRLHQQVSRSADLLQTYAGLIGLIEKKTFEARRLKSLQQKFRTKPMASEAVKQLSKFVNRLDTRLNILVAIPLNLFFFWDIRVCLALERWKKRHAHEVNAWLSAMAEFEVLNSLANTAFNNPDWIMPEIVPDYFIFRAKDLGHPLIAENRRIRNDIQILSGGRILIITGSNMSGKSTFLRTCGVNTMLALSGAPVCAAALTLSHVSLYSSMRILDSLEDNTSSFYAELKRLAVMIKRAEQDPRVFLLLDEILRGTNSQDRYTGSVALIRQLSEYGTVALIATHDLNLAGMEKDMPGRIDNYHFDVKVDGEELYFDYKLTPGICRSMNASILMKKMGIRIQ
jgi:DNA mismatch repair ATPase MutS